MRRSRRFFYHKFSSAPRRLLCVVMGLSLFGCSGCMTTLTQCAYWVDSPVKGAVVYGGTLIDGAGVSGYIVDASRGDPPETGREWFWLAFGIVDLPFCVVADTVLLPLTIAQRADLGLKVDIHRSLRRSAPRLGRMDEYLTDRSKCSRSTRFSQPGTGKGRKGARVDHP